MNAALHLIYGTSGQVKHVPDLNCEELQNEPTLAQFGQKLEELQLSGSPSLFWCICALLYDLVGLNPG